MAGARSFPRIGWRPWRYDDRIASVRLRSLLPCEHLRRAGFDASIVPADGSRLAPGAYDCVVFQKAYGQHDLDLARRFLDQGTKILFDLCDNHFYNPTGDPRLAERASRLDAMIDLCEAVTTPSPELAALVANRPTFIVDDVLDVPALPPLWRALDPLRSLARRRGREARLVWFGNSGSLEPSFGLVHLAGLLPVLARLHRSLPLRLTVISNSKEAFDRHLSTSTVPARYVEWRAGSFAREFRQHDVCLLPVEANPFTIGKSNNRLVLSLMLGVPVVASDLPSYRPFSSWTLTGDWETNVRRYLDDSALAERHVREAQDHIRATFTPERTVDQWGTACRYVLEKSAR